MSCSLCQEGGTGRHWRWSHVSEISLKVLSSAACFSLANSIILAICCEGGRTGLVRRL